MNLHVLPAGPIQTNAYLLIAPERGEAVLIDAPGEVWPLVVVPTAASALPGAVLGTLLLPRLRVPWLRRAVALHLVEVEEVANGE